VQQCAGGYCYKKISEAQSGPECPLRSCAASLYRRSPKEEGKKKGKEGAPRFLTGEVEGKDGPRRISPAVELEPGEEREGIGSHRLFALAGSARSPERREKIGEEEVQRLQQQPSFAPSRPGGKKRRLKNISASSGGLKRPSWPPSGSF